MFNCGYLACILVVASLSFAELLRLSLYKIEYTVETNSGTIGPNGPEGFQNIRWIFENNVSPDNFLVIAVSSLLTLIILLIFMENSKLFKNARLVGKDQIVAQSIGIRPFFYRVGFITLAGGVAGFGGGLFALFNTYIEPSMFGIMLGVHGLAYSIIGGLGYPLGPLIGVFIDIGLLESVRFLSEYRMILFGGLVAAILIIFPEGIISPRLISRIKRKLVKKTMLELKGLKKLLKEFLFKWCRYFDQTRHQNWFVRWKWTGKSTLLNIATGFLTPEEEQ